MNKNTHILRQWFWFAAGVVLVAACGLLLGESFLGQSWVNASYDYIFRFGSHPVANDVVLILMDNDSFDEFHQTRGQPWDRGLHAQLLNKLADDHCRLVVMDSYFRLPRNPEKDNALAAAMQRLNIVLMAAQAQVENSGFTDAHPLLPCQPFLAASRTNWGVAWLDPDLDLVVRRHWPFPDPGPYPSMMETAAKNIGFPVSPQPQERWLRYYGPNGPWTELSYVSALAQSPGFFRNKIIFIGNQPKTLLPYDEEDEFKTPYSRWTGESTGGVKILATEFLNLVHHDWLNRPAQWVEMVIFILGGIFWVAALNWLRWTHALIGAGIGAIVATVLAVTISYQANIWFPWLAIVGGQIPCALAWSIGVGRFARPVVSGVPGKKVVRRPKIPGYKVVHPPFGQGTFGSVWLARNPAGEWCALKVVERSNFSADSNAYDRELAGINTYKTISGQHPGLLRVDHVSENANGAFYYAMELGDSLDATWRKKPSRYRPHDLAGERAQAENRRLPVDRCVQIGLALTEAMEFLHQRSLAHRDIKPQNIIFVNGQPKLADMGLIREVRPAEEIRTIIGTPGYMPPSPEPNGTPQADIFALGMVLYVISTGQDVTHFPEIPTQLMESATAADFLGLNAIYLKAGHARLEYRYASAKELREDLEKLRERLAAGLPASD